MDITEEVATLSQDLGCLREAFGENVHNRAVVLRMCAAKAEHAGSIMRQLADALDQGLIELG